VNSPPPVESDLNEVVEEREGVDCMDGMEGFDCIEVTVLVSMEEGGRPLKREGIDLLSLSSKVKAL